MHEKPRLLHPAFHPKAQAAVTPLSTAAPISTAAPSSTLTMRERILSRTLMDQGARRCTGRLCRPPRLQHQQWPYNERSGRRRPRQRVAVRLAVRAAGRQGLRRICTRRKFGRLCGQAVLHAQKDNRQSIVRVDVRPKHDSSGTLVFHMDKAKLLHGS